MYNVLNYIRTTPNPGRQHKITEELIDLSTMAMEYFKDHLLPQFGLLSEGSFGKSSTTTRKCLPQWSEIYQLIFSIQQYTYTLPDFCGSVQQWSVFFFGTL